MRVLLDTHALLWAMDSPENLSARALTALQSADVAFVSIASLWEIAIKSSLKKLKLHGDFGTLFPSCLEASGLRILNLSVDHLVVVSSLQRFHRDPFDRLIIAQAQHERLSVITCDARYQGYPIATVW